MVIKERLLYHRERIRIMCFRRRNNGERKKKLLVGVEEEQGHGELPQDDAVTTGI